MSPLNFTHILIQTVDKLSGSELNKRLFHLHKNGELLSLAKTLHKKIKLLRFPKIPVGSLDTFRHGSLGVSGFGEIIHCS